jgi:hypothetical protein
VSQPIQFVLTQDESDPRQRYSTLFTCLYHQQIINLHRPSLSLSPTQTQHAYALQSTIASVRTILSLLSKDTETFWPGYVDMVFFGCLILVYGSRSKLETRLHNDLNRAMRILEGFQNRWNNLRPFLKVVQAFIDKASPASTTTNTMTPTADVVPAFDFNDLFASDFSFDFTNFEINPEVNWAYHMSMPSSPNL